MAEKRIVRWAGPESICNKLIVISSIEKIETHHVVQGFAVELADRKHVRNQLKHQLVLPDGVVNRCLV